MIAALLKGYDCGEEFENIVCIGLGIRHWHIFQKTVGLPSGLAAELSDKSFMESMIISVVITMSDKVWLAEYKSGAKSYWFRHRFSLAWGTNWTGLVGVCTSHFCQHITHHQS